MKCIAWNCRGLNETKCTVTLVSSYFGFYGFPKSVGVDAVGSKGGIWVGWTPSWDAICITKCTNFIILKINECGGRFWYLFCIYGSPKKEKCLDVWLALESWIAKVDSYFLMLGDFNQVEFKEDKYGGSKDRIYERIDKGLASEHWNDIYPRTRIKHLPIQCSDHAPIILDTDFFDKTKKRRFKLEAWSFDYPECTDILKAEWFQRDRGSPMKNSWNNKWSEFDDNLESELLKFFQGGAEDRFIQIHKEYIEFNRAAVLFWKQRSKLTWLKEGDACTLFFFNSVQRKHSRNFISGLKDGNGTWVFDKDSIRGLFEDFFKDIYQSSCPREPLQEFSNSHQALFATVKNKLLDDQFDSFARKFTRKLINLINLDL
ncbi:uncharacterized protein LOC141640495 [Silene latifolia]|uniref:uncharacterized protein LOC141640495 n=1 Tax=Silene latifolia TaxID=37657 RepID=UPI003D7835C6